MEFFFQPTSIAYIAHLGSKSSKGGGVREEGEPLQVVRPKCATADLLWPYEAPSKPVASHQEEGFACHGFLTFAMFSLVLLLSSQRIYCTQ